MITTAKEKQRHAIILDVLHRHGLSMDDLMSRSRREKYVDARVEIASRLADIGFSYSRIGKILERDHSTVGHWLNHRRGGRLPQNLTPIAGNIRNYIEGLAAQRRTTAKQIIIEWITERALFEASRDMEKAA